MFSKIAFKTIGCKVNQYETGTFKYYFKKLGYQILKFNQIADIYIINTCAVTQEAERKSRQMIRKAKRLNPNAKIIVTGCAVDANIDAIKNCDNIKIIASNYYKNSPNSQYFQYKLASRHHTIT